MRKWIALLGLSCASPQPTTIPLNGAADDQFTVTQVVMENGVARVVATSTVTRAEEVQMAMQRLRAEEESVAREAITVDPLCNGNDLWMWDQNNFQGNEICLASVGGEFLFNFPRGGGNWQQAVRSFYGGNYDFEFSENCRYRGCYESFQPWVYQLVADSTASYAKSVGINCLAMPSPPPNCSDLNPYP